MQGGDYTEGGLAIADLRLYLICDSYMGTDLQEDVRVKF